MTMNPTQFLKKIKCVLTLAVLMIFASTQLSNGYSYPMSASDISRIHLFNTSTVVLPPEIGKIEEVFNGKSNKTVVLIQDAHAIPEAQRNIQKMIDYFQNQGIDLVALEGSSADLDPQILKSFPNKGVLKKVFDEYFEKGEMTGGVASAVFNSSPTVYSGVEDWDLYQEGLNFYIDAMYKQPQLLKKQAVLEEHLQLQKKNVYSKELLLLDQALQSFQRNQNSLEDILILFAKFEKPRKGTELAITLEEIERKNKNSDGVGLEIRAIAKKAEAFLKSLPASSQNIKTLKLFNQKLQQFRVSEVSAQELASLIQEISVSQNFDVKFSGELHYLMQCQKKIRDVEGTRFLEDLEIYFEDTKAKLLKNLEQQKLNDEDRRLKLLSRLIRLEMNREDWNAFKINAAHLISPFSTGMLRSHIQFYENAEKRDGVFFSKLLSLMKKSKTESAILVAGGFHTEGLTQQFRKQSISYLLLRPQISSVPAIIHYRDQMTGEVSWKKYLTLENGRIDLYKAFIRGTQEKLMAQNEEQTGNFFKNWRDRIISDLAREGRIASASEYTSLIDNMSGGKFNKERSEHLIKVNKFLEKLNALDAKGKLSVAHVMNLFPSAAISGRYAGTPAIVTPRSFLAPQISLRSELREDAIRDELVSKIRFKIRQLRDEYLQQKLEEKSKVEVRFFQSEFTLNFSTTLASFVDESRRMLEALEDYISSEPAEAVFNIESSNGAISISKVINSKTALEWWQERDLAIHEHYRKGRVVVDPAARLFFQQKIAPSLKGVKGVVEIGAGPNRVLRSWAGGNIPFWWEETDWDPNVLQKIESSATAELPARTKLVDLRDPLPYRKSSVPAIVSLAALDTIPVPELERIFKEFVRVLEPGGPVVIELDLRPNMEIEVNQTKRENPNLVLFPFYVEIRPGVVRPTGAMYVKWKEFEAAASLSGLKSNQPLWTMILGNKENPEKFAVTYESFENGRKAMALMTEKIIEVGAQRPGVLEKIEDSLPDLHMRRLRLAAEKAGLIVHRAEEVDLGFHTFPRNSVTGLGAETRIITYWTGHLAFLGHPHIPENEIHVDYTAHLFYATKKKDNRSEVRIATDLSIARFRQMDKLIWAAVATDQSLKEGAGLSLVDRRAASVIIISAGPKQFGELLRSLSAYRFQPEAIQKEQRRLVNAYKGRFAGQKVVLGVVFPSGSHDSDLKDVGELLLKIPLIHGLVLQPGSKLISVLRKIQNPLSIRQVNFAHSSFVGQDSLAVAVLGGNQGDLKIAKEFVPFTAFGADKVDYSYKAEVHFMQFIIAATASQLLKEQPELSRNHLELRFKILEVIGQTYSKVLVSKAHGMGVDPTAIRAVNEYLARIEIGKSA